MAVFSPPFVTPLSTMLSSRIAVESRSLYSDWETLNLVKAMPPDHESTNGNPRLVD